MYTNRNESVHTATGAKGETTKKHRQNVKGHRLRRGKETETQNLDIKIIKSQKINMLIKKKRKQVKLQENTWFNKQTNRKAKKIHAENVRRGAHLYLTPE